MSRITFNNLVPSDDDRRDFKVLAGRVIDSGRYLYGPNVQWLERRLKGYLGGLEVCAVGSGTDALYLALRALGLGPGEKILTVANSAPATVSAIRATGAFVEFCDVDGRGLMTPATLRRALDTKVGIQAIVPVHLYGQLCDIPGLLDVAKEYHVGMMVEDAAQALGSKATGWTIGELTQAAILSFYPTKSLGALGDGGAIVTSKPNLYQRIRALSFYGIVDKENLTMELSGGINSRMDEFQAAFLAQKMTNLDYSILDRANLASLYHRLIPAEYKHRDFEPTENQHIMTVVCPDRALVRKKMLADEVETGVHYPTPAHRYPNVGSNCAIDLPMTEKLASQVLSLPLHSKMGHRAVRRVVEVFLKAVRR